MPKPGPAPDTKRRKQAQALRRTPVNINVKRWREAAKLRRSGLTLAEVGEAMDPPVSRQRVHAMLRSLSLLTR